MHKLEGEYTCTSTGYRCSLRIKGGEVYVVFNLEIYWKLRRLSGEHCDFIYICSKDKKWHIFVVELKDIKNNKLNMKKLWTRIRNKLVNSLNIVESEILKFFKIQNGSIKYHGVFVVPSEFLALIKHTFRINYRPKQNIYYSILKKIYFFVHIKKLK